MSYTFLYYSIATIVLALVFAFVSSNRFHSDPILYGLVCVLAILSTIFSVQFAVKFGFGQLAKLDSQLGGDKLIVGQKYKVLYRAGSIIYLVQPIPHGDVVAYQYLSGASLPDCFEVTNFGYRARYKSISCPR